MYRQIHAVLIGKRGGVIDKLETLLLIYTQVYTSNEVIFQGS